MHKFIKVCLIIAAIMISLGIFIAVIVTAVSGRSLFHNLNPVNVNIFPFRTLESENSWDININLPGGRWNRRNNMIVNGSKIGNQTYEAVFNAGEISEISIKAGAGDFKVIGWDNSDFKIIIDGRGEVKYNSRGKTLNIEGFNSFKVNSFNSLTLYVPENRFYDELDITVGAGMLSVSGLKVAELESAAGAGRIVMNDMIVGELEIDNGVGETTFRGEVSGDIKANCAAGSISLKIKGDEADFNYRINCAIGHISLGSSFYGGLAAEKSIDNNADKKMRLECAIGNIDVSFY